MEFIYEPTFIGHFPSMNRELLIYSSYLFYISRKKEHTLASKCACGFLFIEFEQSARIWNWSTKRPNHFLVLNQSKCGSHETRSHVFSSSRTRTITTNFFTHSQMKTHERERSMSRHRPHCYSKPNSTTFVQFSALKLITPLLFLRNVTNCIEWSAVWAWEFPVKYRKQGSF